MKTKSALCIGLVVGVILLALVSSVFAEVVSDGTDELRYGKTNIKGVNVRSKANPKSDTPMKIPITGSAVLILQEVEGTDNNIWYAVKYNDDDGFIRSDLIDEITKEEYDEILVATLKPKRNASSNQTKVASLVTPEGHGGLGTGTRAFAEGGVYHSDLACPKVVGNATETTLSAAQSQGLEPCYMCWCLECVYGEH